MDQKNVRHQLSRIFSMQRQPYKQTDWQTKLTDRQTADRQAKNAMRLMALVPMNARNHKSVFSACKDSQTDHTSAGVGVSSQIHLEADRMIPS